MDNQFFVQNPNPIQTTPNRKWKKALSIVGLVLGALALENCLSALLCYNSGFISIIDDLMNTSLGSSYYGLVGSIAAFITTLLALPMAIVGFVLALKGARSAEEAGVSSGLAKAGKIVAIIGFAFTCAMVFISLCVLVGTAITFKAPSPSPSYSYSYRYYDPYTGRYIYY